ncbi:uncharacterized protein ALTATR162_LOCUS5076 [Alternaria atra]|uniref:Transmembrane protein n=1 Tax=Alternaria atra TaxID=119953 RepID=A0A8J2N5R0_9PLEO|nr:uncharacterized protein ALTATR162_LOCUS5076 [Alternaria atra]CAG5158431.1 unnamed protein product [Alternaria atra]
MFLRDLFKWSRDATPHPQPQQWRSNEYYSGSPTDPPRVDAFAFASSPLPAHVMGTSHYLSPSAPGDGVVGRPSSPNTETPKTEDDLTKAQVKQALLPDQKDDPEGVLDDKITLGVSQSRSERIKRLKPLPPTSMVVEPFGGLKSPLITTSYHLGLPNSYTPSEGTSSSNEKEDVTKKPTCSLNLVCYSRGCVVSQIQVTMPTKFETKEDYDKTMARYPKIITSDEGLFKALRDRYQNKMCGFWRRCFSLKTLKCLRLLSYTLDTRPSAVPFDEMTMQEVLYAYNHPSEFGPETDWVEWIFRLRQPDKRHALEFVEGWNRTRIAILGVIPCIASTLVGVIWSSRGGDVQTAFTVAAFILTLATVLLALLAVISGIDSKPR